MAAFLVRRLAQSGLILFIVIFLTYWLMGLMPGDPIDLMVQSNPDLTPADSARLKALYGLDQPIMTRFWNWLTQALQGDFGYSRLFGQPVWTVLWPRLVNTLILMLPVVVLSIAIAVPLGLLAARKAYGWFDYTINMASFAGISIPPFWFAILMIIGFAVVLNWLPASAAPPGDAGLIDHLRHLVLPVATLTILNVGSYLRFMRAASLQTLRQDYVRTAQAKGVGETRLLTHHVLRNALLPLVTIIALSFGSLFSGTLIIETIFAWPGMGKTIYDSVLGNDYNLAMVGFLLATATTLLGNILADLCYGLLDPRIELEEVKLGG